MTDADTDAERPPVGIDAATGSDDTDRPPADREFGWQGWVLVGALVVSLVVVPWSLVMLPEVQGFVESLGLGLRDAYLVLPLVPAFGLGALGVWAALSARGE